MGPNSRSLRLRPHHILCLVAFQGEGYSPEFIEKARRLRQSLLTHGVPVELAHGPDDLCASCPELKDECLSPAPEGGVERLDRAAAELLGLEPGLHSSQELIASLKESFSLEGAYRVCAGCSWLGPMDCPKVIAARLEGL